MPKILGTVVVVGLVALIAYLYSTNRDSFAALLHLKPLDISMIIAAAFGFIASQGFILRAACKPFKVVLGHLEAFGLLVVTFFVNYMIPFIGFGVRGAYLNKRHGMSVPDFGSSLIATLAIELSVYAAAGLVALLVLWQTGAAFDLILALVMSGAIAAGLLAAFVPLDWLPIRQVAVRSAITRIGEAQVLLRRPATLFAMIAWTFVQFASLTACFWTTFRAIAAPIPASGAVITAALTDFSLLLRFTPAAVGTFEGAVYYAVHPLGVTLAHAILAALLVRLALAAIFLPFGSIAFIHQVQRLGLTASAAPSKPSK